MLSNKRMRGKQFKEDGTCSICNKDFCYLKIMIQKKRFELLRIRSLNLIGKKTSSNK